jgi:colicin import membrane protein
MDAKLTQVQKSSEEAMVQAKLAPQKAAQAMTAKWNGDSSLREAEARKVADAIAVAAAAEAKKAAAAKAAEVVKAKEAEVAKLVEAAKLKAVEEAKAAEAARLLTLAGMGKSAVPKVVEKTRVAKVVTDSASGEATADRIEGASPETAIVVPTTDDKTQV